MKEKANYPKKNKNNNKKKIELFLAFRRKAKTTSSDTLASIVRHSIWSDTLWMFQMKGALTQGMKLSSDVIVNY